MKKRSLFQRLSGSHTVDDEYDFEEDYAPADTGRRTAAPQASVPVQDKSEGHLPVDMYQTATDIVIRTFVAGVRADDMNVSISRDMVVIEGSRDERNEVTESDYFSQELFWGAFSRTIMLPQEIDVDGASAGSKDGLLVITLPKLDRTRQTKLRVKSG